MSFKPWIGKNYKSRKNKFSGIRLLVLGESHYRDDPSKEAFSQDPCWEPYKNKYGEENFTSFVLKKWGRDEDETDRFFTMVANVLLNSSGGRNTQNAEIWDHVAFYNYVSTLVRSKDDCPEPEQWQESMEPFITVLQNLEPDAVLMLGKKLTKWIVPKHNHGEYKNLFVPYINNDINYLGIKHPRGGLAYEEANPAFQQLYNETGHRLNQ